MNVTVLFGVPERRRGFLSPKAIDCWRNVCTQCSYWLLSCSKCACAPCAEQIPTFHLTGA